MRNTNTLQVNSKIDYDYLSTAIKSSLKLQGIEFDDSWNYCIMKPNDLSCCEIKILDGELMAVATLLVDMTQFMTVNMEIEVIPFKKTPLRYTGPAYNYRRSPSLYQRFISKLNLNL